MLVWWSSQHLQQNMDQPGKVVNPARGQRKRESYVCFPVPVYAGEFGRVRPFRPMPDRFILHNQAESGTYSRDSSRFRRRRPHWASPEFLGSRNCVSMAFTSGTREESRK